MATTSGDGQAVFQEASFTVPGNKIRRQRTPHPQVLTAQLNTKPFTVLGVTWDRTAGLGAVVIRYRVRESGKWTSWSGVTASDAAPDPGTPDARSGSRGATDPIVAVNANGLQIWAETSSGRLSGIKAVLIDPGADPVGANVTNAGFQTAAVTAPTQPSIVSRAEWGANESLKACSPDYSNSVVSAAVHHTASTNAYAASDVAGIIRGIYSYHTRAPSAGGQGWCDIGYNFLVDSFGRIFEGRAGGITSTVVGAHTGGFNAGTIGVSAIGNYATAAAPPAMVESISRLIAWKFSVHHILAGTSVRMVSAGGESKYPAGTAVTFPTIYGHRDAGLTTCPGQHLYDLLPSIRSRVASLSNESVAVSPLGVVDAYTGTSAGVGVKGWAFDPESAASL
ncbi:MAG: peptidoglycan recognition protein, partial [Propionicimonas sp.]